MIPKVIHYCWLSNDPVPDDLKRYMSSWKRMLPDYEFKKWDFSVFDKSSSKWVSDAFDNKKYAFACDYIRLFAVYHYGGIYMDMDVEVVKPFNDLLNSQYFFGYENDKENSIEAGVFGAEKGNPFLKDCLGYYEGREFVRKDGSYADRPLPSIMFQIFRKGNYQFPIMNWHRLTAKSYLTGEVLSDEHTYTIHHFAGSWLDDERKNLRDSRQHVSKKYGVTIGRIWSNLLQYTHRIKEKGISGALQLTKEKVMWKLGRYD